jgi:succinate dehydrogenase / fumarate reductase membrane anchor subunit
MADRMLADKRAIADPASHYGDPKAATRGFKWQRLTGGMNVLFLGFLIWLVVRLAGTGRADMVMVLQDHPVVSIVLGLLIVNVCVHMRIGMREIIEDYVHEPRLTRLSMTLNDMFALLVAAAALISLIKIVFWG